MANGDVSSCTNLQIGSPVDGQPSSGNTKLRCEISSFDLRLSLWQRITYLNPAFLVGVV